MTSTSLPVTLGHAVWFLITPLISVYPLQTLIALQHILNTTLEHHLKSSWDETNPLNGSGRRCLSLSPRCTPSRPIRAACVATGVKWAEWIQALGGQEFDMFIDPGCISVRIIGPGRQSRMYTVWADEVPLPTETQHRRPAYTFQKRGLATVAERPSSRASASSNSSCDSGYASATSSLTAVSSTCSISEGNVKSSIAASSPSGMSRRQRAMMRRMVVDHSNVTPKSYEGGRTTVLTGGTMLGTNKTTAKASTEYWQSL